MRTEISHTLTFGANGTAQPLLRDGWSGPENGFTWAIGASSTLALPAISAPHGFFIEITTLPFIDTETKAQNIHLRIGAAVHSMAISHPGVFACFFASPADALIIEHPDHRRPTGAGDGRPFALLVRRLRILAVVSPDGDFTHRRSPAMLTCSIAQAETLTAMPIVPLVGAIESIAGNCELGFFQRYCGAEPLSLLRFADPQIGIMVDAIDAAFAGIGDPGDIEPDGRGGTWMINEKRYHLRYHTFRNVADVPEEQEKREQSIKAKFLARKYMESIEGGEKIFVVKDESGSLLPEEVQALLLAINRRGQGRVLWIVPAPDAAYRGAVEWIAPHLMRGYISSFAPSDDPARANVQTWLAVCVNAWLLVQPRIKG